MTKTGYKNIFIALLLLAFTSQSFAALMMPCQFESKAYMDDMARMNHSDVEGMDHSSMAGMDHSEMAGDIKTDTNPMSDCCKTPPKTAL